MRRARTALLILALTATGTSTLLAQSSPPDFLVEFGEHFDTSAEKVVALARAMPEESYPWSPMEGVRSVSDVFALIIAECHVFPAAWGHEPPAGAASGFGPELLRASALTRTEIVRELDSAFDHLIGIVRGMDEAERMADSDYFGRPMKIHANILISMGDMHEHLGQLIAYARTNEVVPPWSR